MVLEPPVKAGQQQVARAAALNLIVNRAVLERRHDPARQPLELAVDDDTAPELEDVGRRSDQPRALEHAPLPPAGIQHHLDVGPEAGLERADAHVREAPVVAAEQRRSGAEQGAVEIDIETAHRAGDRTITGRVSIAGETWTDLLEQGRADERLVHEGITSARRPRTVPPPFDLSATVAQALHNVGINDLYAHQAEAFEHAFAQPTIITTGTASGKSLCFQLPTLEVLSTDRTARALYLYPTKSLAQDQARALHAFGLHTAIRPAIYDGDTPRNERAAIRRRSNLILTNPDMLHVGILPHHESWDELLANLAFVVVDEAHVYRGVFGSHVANVLRRLRRAAAIHGTEPRFLLASATIANPIELATQLTGLPDFHLVDDDAAPRPERRTVMWNPPLLDEELGVRGSALYEAAEVFSELIRAGARTICFMKSRKGIELILKHARDRLDPELAERVAPYRAGYTPAQRQDIQRRLTAGDLLGVVATDALELGIDIGELDAAICVTFPGTVSSLRQMWGRAGRRERGLAVYIAGEDALDQFFCRHPDEFLERPVEAAILDPDNPQIYAEHLVCAAHEAPLSDADAPFLGAEWRTYAEELAEAGFLRERATGLRPAPRR